MSNVELIMFIMKYIQKIIWFFERSSKNLLSKLYIHLISFYIYNSNLNFKCVPI